MANAFAAIWNALDSGSPIVVLYYPDLDAQAWLAGELKLLCEGEVREIRALDEARAHPDALCLLLADDEGATVKALDGGRDLHVDRERPLILFLLRGGRGQEILKRSPSLASWIRGNDLDPEALAEVDVDVERRAFEEETGQDPEAWLEAHRGRDHEDLDALGITYRALLLER